MIRSNTMARQTQIDPIICGNQSPEIMARTVHLVARAHQWSPQMWTSEHRGWIAAALVVLGISGLLAFLKNR
jgi:hypothetical protein